MEDLNFNNPLLDSNVTDRLNELSVEDQLFFRNVLNDMHQNNEELLKELERLQQKKTQKRDPLSKDIYKALINQANGPGYIKARLRIGFCLLTLSGVTINEVLELKVDDIKPLLDEEWIKINLTKRGHSNNKAFLSKEGKKVIQDRRKDFDQIFGLKESNSFIFSSEKNHQKSLSRESFTRQINQVMKVVSEELGYENHITSHSLKNGYIQDLWKDKNDIQFVTYKIGKRTI